MATYEPVERFIDERYKDCHITKMQLSASYEDAIHSWIKKPSKFLVFMGTPGTSKTFNAIAITRRLFEIASKNVKYPSIFYYPQYKIFEEFKELYQNKWGDESLKDRLNNCLLLTIDDFGNTRNNEWQVEIMTQIIENRYNSKKPTIVTTNLTWEQIGDQYHPRVRDRLEACENLAITNWEPSLRQQGL